MVNTFLATKNVGSPWDSRSLVSGRARHILRTRSSCRSLIPDVLDLPIQEFRGALKLFHAVEAVFDGDPAVEAGGFQRCEHGGKVVDSGADLTVDELGVVGDS